MWRKKRKWKGLAKWSGRNSLFLRGNMIYSFLVTENGAIIKKYFDFVLDAINFAYENNYIFLKGEWE